MAKILRSPATSVVLFVLAALLLVGGGVGMAQSAPRIESQDWRGEVVLTDIHTAITEYSKSVTENNQVTGEETHFIVREGDDDLLNESKSHFLADNGDDAIKIGKTYPYQLAVRNVALTGEDKNPIDQYVRVTVQKYWTNENDQGVKHCDLDPSLINIEFDESNGWKIDSAASPPERTVLYYEGTSQDGGILTPGADSTPFTKSITISGKTVTAMSDGVYDYEGLKFRIKATVDAVQTHNAEDAMTSAWGRTNK